MLRGAAGEVEHDPLARRRSRARAARDRPPAPRRRRAPRARRRRAPRSRRARAARRSRAPTSSASRERRGPEPARERLEPPRADDVRGELGAQVGAALGRLAHPRDERVDQRRLERLRRDHDALLVERAAVGRHRAGGAPADVGVVGARRGEADQAAVEVRRRDDRDVGQVRAAGERVVEDPAAPGRAARGRARPRPRPASSRGGRGCARPA